MNNGLISDKHPNEELMFAINELLEIWEQMSSPETGKLQVQAPKVNRKRQAFDRARSALLLGFCAHIMQLTRSARLLLSESQVVQGIPLARMAYECMLKQNWVYASGPDAPQALSNEYARNRKNLHDTMKNSKIPYLEEAADTIAGLDHTVIETSSNPHARNLEKMIEDFDGGDDLYTYYRMLSEYSHASSTIADLYLSSPGEGEFMPDFDSEPRPFPKKMVTYFVVFSSCRAMYALATTMKDKTFRDSVRRIALRCEVNLDMKLSSAPWKRKAARI